MNWKNVLQGLLTAAAKKDARYYLLGIHVKVNLGGEVVLEATDGHMAMQLTLQENPGFPTDTCTILDRKSLEQALKLPEAALVWHEGQYYYGPLPVATIDGRFPDVSRVLPKNLTAQHTAPVGFDCDLMAQLCKAISLTVKGMKYHCATMQARGAMDVIIFERDTPDFSLRAGLMPCRT